MLVLYTDGLIERRSGTIFDHMERLRAVIEATANVSSIDDIAGFIVDELGITADDGQSDDAALRLLRRSPPAPVAAACHR